MFETELFLAFPVSFDYSRALDAVPAALKTTFIDSQGYLKSLEYEGVSYLTKSLGDTIDEEGLKLASKHLCSLLQKLVPTYIVDESSLVLIAQLKNRLPEES